MKEIGMKVGELRKVIAGIPDDTLVVVTKQDHQYREASVGATKAVRESKRRLSEYHGPEYIEAGMVVIDVVVID